MPTSWAIRPAVYPRVCGGTAGAVQQLRVVLGLSPRVRGNQRRDQFERGPVRSIPACAGEPSGRKTTRALVRVYPRVCGGTQGIALANDSSRGLSPRVRGNPFYGIPHIFRSGSIPACAGEPAWGGVTGDRGAVYPRVCGGTMTWHSMPDRPGGLSPRVRGNRLQLRGHAALEGSIPACAGEPPSHSA